MSEISVVLDSPLPPYEQIRRGILAQLTTGALRPGDRLPSIRALAVDLGIAPGTVARAYRELEEQKVLRTGRGAGTRIADPLPDGVIAGPGADVDPGLAAILAAPVAEALAAGHEAGSIAEAVRDLLALVGGPRTEGRSDPGTLDQ